MENLDPLSQIKDGKIVRFVLCVAWFVGDGSLLFFFILSKVVDPRLQVNILDTFWRDKTVSVCQFL